MLAPDDHAVGTGHEVGKLAFDDGAGDVRHFAFVRRIDAAQAHRQHLRLAHGQRFDLDVRAQRP